MTSWRWRSVLEGAVYTLVISGGAGIGQALLEGAWRGVLFLVVLIGLFFGGFVAGRGTSATRPGTGRSPPPVPWPSSRRVQPFAVSSSATACRW